MEDTRALDGAGNTQLIAKSTHRVETFILGELTKHPNADTLSTFKIADTDYTHVVRTEDWAGSVGKLVAWIPPDSIVDVTRPEFIFLGPKGSRIRAKKLRGIVSYGLCVPAPEGLNPGDDAAAALGVTHYDPELARGGGNKSPKDYSMGGGESASPPSGAYSSYDVDAFMKYGRRAFVLGEPVYVSEKIHGASARYVFQDGVMHVGSRTEWKREFPAPPTITLEELTAKVGAERAALIYEKAVTNFRPKRNMWWVALDGTPGIRNFCEAHPGWCVYGEVYGNVQGLKYGAQGSEVWFAAFDIRLPGMGSWLEPVDFKRECDTFLLPRVPDLGMFPFDFDQIVAMAEGNSEVPGAHHIREGVVVKPEFERYDDRFGRVSLSRSSIRRTLRRTEADSMAQIWITKYALTQGVFLCEGTISQGSGRMVEVTWPGSLNDRAYFHGQDWHLNAVSARDRVLEMISARKKSLARSEDVLAKLAIKMSAVELPVKKPGK